MKHKTKSPLKLTAAAVMLFFAAAPLHAADAFHPVDALHAGEPVQRLGFAEAGEAPLPPLNHKDLPAVAVGDGARIFSLDLYFGTDTHPVVGIAPLIHFNSAKIEVIGILGPVRAGFGMPDEDTFRDRIRRRQPDPPLPAITMDGVAVDDDTDTVLSLAWLDLNEIGDVATATVDAPVHIITITFQWKAGATGNSHIGITQSAFGIAHDFQTANILVRGPAVAHLTATPASIDATAGATKFDVTCAMSRPFPATETTCALARPRNAKALVSTIRPAIDGAAIVISPNATSGTLSFRITPSAADSGRMLGMRLRSAIAGGKSLARDLNPAQIPLMSPGLMLSKSGMMLPESGIETAEGGEAAKFSVKLATRLANAHVVVKIVSSDPSEAALAPASLTFTAGNWDEAQVVSVTGVDDKYVDGDKAYMLYLAVDTGKTGAMHYHGITESVRGTTTDNDEAKPVLKVEPGKNSATGTRQIAISVTLTGGGIFASDTWIDFGEVGGSALAGIDYAPFTLPEYITIPAGTTFAAATFALTMTGAAVKTIIIPVTLSGSETRIPDIILATGTFDWDVDKSGRITAQDGIMIARYLLGVRGQALVDGQSKARHSAVAERIKNGLGALDVSGDGVVDDTDGILIARYFLGLRGAALVRGFSPRPDSDAVEEQIRFFSRMPVI